MKRTVLFLLVLSLGVPVIMAQTDLFPEMKPWTRETEIKTYDTETLWEYINGAAEYYLRFGFQKLETVEYALDENNYLKAELYWHSSPLNTFGIYAFERPSDGGFLNIGNEGYKAASALNFYSGNCYVKIHSNQTDSFTLKTIENIATAISEKLASQGGEVSELKILPEEQRIAHSEKHIPENYLGYSFFKNVITASFQDDKNSYEMFCIAFENNDSALEPLKRYATQMNLESDFKPDTIYTFDDVFNGMVSVIVSNSMLWGVVNAKPENESGNILRKILE